MGLFDTIGGIMKQKKGKPSKQRQIDNHYRSTADEYEFIARMAHESEIAVADYTRRKLIPMNYLIKLDDLRAKQRKRGDEDAWFIHPKFMKAS